MNKLNELKKQYEELGEEISKLESQPWPSWDGKYFYIDGGHLVADFNYPDTFDIYRRQTGNMFKTRENAKLWLKIHNRVHELIGDWKPDWSCLDDKCFISYPHISSGFNINLSFNHQYQGVTYMPSEVAEKIINEFGDDLKIWVCGEDI